MLLAPLASIMLGVASVVARSLGGFSLTTSGADFALISCSLQVGLIFEEMGGRSEDAVWVIIFFVLWLIALKSAQLAQRTTNRYLMRLYPLLAFAIGTFSLSIEILVIRRVPVLA